VIGLGFDKFVAPVATAMTMPLRALTCSIWLIILS